MKLLQSFIIIILTLNLLGQNTSSHSKSFVKEGFRNDCDTVNSVNSINDNLLLNLSFEDFFDEAPNQIDIENNGVTLIQDRFSELDAGDFGQNRYLRMEHDEILKPNFPMSFSFWVKREFSGIGNNYVYTSDLQLDKRAGFAISFGAFNDKLIFFYSDEDGCYNPACRRQMTSEMAFPNGQWFHIIISVTAYNDATFYVDGCEIPIVYSGEGDTDLYYSEEDSYIGFADNTNQTNNQRSYFGGSIDDFYFWNRVITEEEVLYLYDRFEIPSIGLLDDYNLCEEDELTFTVNSEFENILWSDGFEGNQRVITDAGIYSIEAYYNCHLVCHEFEVVIEPTEISLGEDIITCDDQVVLITPVSVEWNTGEVGNFLIVTETGTYSASFQSECSIIKDTIYVELQSDQSINLQDSYEICQGTSIMLNIDEGYESVLWSNGTSGNSITILEPGPYQVIAEETVCPPDTHTFLVQTQDTILDVEIDEEILLCNSESTTINIPDGSYQIEWNNIEGENMYVTQGDEDILLTLSNECDEDNYFINVNSVLPESIEEVTKSICIGDSVILYGPEHVDQYLWSTSSTSNSITVHEEGIYSLTYNKNGCFFDAQIASIYTENCIECNFYIPNVISLGSNAGNREFQILSNHEECLKDINVNIFDRWGNHIYRGTAQDRWDGLFNSEKVETGVFVVHVIGNFDGSPINFYKDLTVLD